jgi:hypothetical protein
MALQARGPKLEPVRDWQWLVLDWGLLHPLGPWQTTWAANTEQAGLSWTKLRGRMTERHRNRCLIAIIIARSAGPFALDHLMHALLTIVPIGLGRTCIVHSAGADTGLQVP